MRPIVSARVLQLYYHNCHNLISGEGFFTDHEFFGASYPRLESDYDRLTEYYICAFGPKAFETKLISKAINEALEKIEVEEMSAKEMYKQAVKFEQKFYKELGAVDKEASIGLRNLVGDLAEQIDVRMYKINQRLVESE